MPTKLKLRVRFQLWRLNCQPLQLDSRRDRGGDNERGDDGGQHPGARTAAQPDVAGEAGAKTGDARQHHEVPAPSAFEPDGVGRQMPGVVADEQREQQHRRGEPTHAGLMVTPMQRDIQRDQHPQQRGDQIGDRERWLDPVGLQAHALAISNGDSLAQRSLPRPPKSPTSGPASPQLIGRDRLVLAIGDPRRHHVAEAPAGLRSSARRSRPARPEARCRRAARVRPASKRRTLLPPPRRIRRP